MFGAALATGVDKLCQEIASRGAYMQKARHAGQNTTKLETMQVSKLCVIIAKTPISSDDGIRVSDSITGSDFAEEHQLTLGLAVTNCVASADDPDHAPGSYRTQQSAQCVEHLVVSESDVAEMAKHNGDEEFVCSRVGSRAWLTGLTCPRETVKARLGALAQVLGGLSLDASCKERKRIAERVRSVIKRRDAKTNYPFPHMQHLPDHASQLPDDRLHFAFGDDKPATLDPDVTEAINELVRGGGVRTTHKDIQARCHGRGGSALALTSERGRGVPTLDLHDAAPVGNDMARMYQGMQQMMMMQMQFMRGMHNGGGVGDMGGLGLDPTLSRGAAGGRPAVVDDALMRYRRGNTRSDPIDGMSGGQCANITTLASQRERVYDNADASPPPPIEAVCDTLDQSIADLEAMERAQIAQAEDAKRRKLEAAQTKAATKKGKTTVAAPAAKAAWDLGGSDDEDDTALLADEALDNVEAAACSPPSPVTPKPCKMFKRPAMWPGLSAHAWPAAASKATPCKPSPKVAAGKGKVAPHSKPKSTIVLHKGGGASAPKAKAKPGAPPPRPLPVASSTRASMHGVSFVDLVQPTAAVAAKSRGAFTSRAYDTTKKRATTKFGKDDVRVLEVSRCAYAYAGDVYSEHAC
jgi:hypothetical protein